MGKISNLKVTVKIHKVHYRDSYWRAGVSYSYEDPKIIRLIRGEIK